MGQEHRGQDVAGQVTVERIAKLFQGVGVAAVDSTGAVHDDVDVADEAGEGLDLIGP